MAKVIRSAGYGILAAGLVLVGLYFWSLHLKGGEVLGDALDPFTLANYRVLSALLPGFVLLWLSDMLADRHSHGERN
jgi:hypothetical protein